HVKLRAANDFQHVGRCRLLFQCLAQVVGPLAQFVEQPRVLNGDDRLSGEVLDQLDLLLGKGTNLLAVDGESADQLIVFEHRYIDRGSSTAERDRRGGNSFGGVVGSVTDSLCLPQAI